LKKIIYTISIIFIICFSEVNSQLTKSEIIDRHITKKGDTILIKRLPGDWWYGPLFGLTYSKYYGKFIFPREIIPGMNQYSEFINYKDGSYFPGIFIGLITEYNPPKSEFGYGLKLTLKDYIKNTLIEKIGDTLRKEYINETKYNYIIFSPYFKYNFLGFNSKIFRGFYAFSGLNLEIPIGAKASHTKAFYNPVRIDETNSYTFQNQLFRYGYNSDSVGIYLMQA